VANKLTAQQIRAEAFAPARSHAGVAVFPNQLVNRSGTADTKNFSSIAKEEKAIRFVHDDRLTRR
jgi:hypothetical protein